MMTFVRKYPVTWFLTLTFLLNWVGMAANVAGVFPALGEWPLRYEGQVVAVLRGRRTLLNWSPNIAALAILVGTSGWEGIREFFKKFFIWRVGWRVWLTAVLGPGLMAGVALLIYVLGGGALDTERVRHLGPVFLMRQLMSLSTGGFGEEGGWRAFALPRLEIRWGPVGAAAIIGIFWALLHAPMWGVRGDQQDQIMVFVFTVMSLSVILTWLFHLSKGSVLLAALMHNQFNVFDATLARGQVDMLPYEAYRTCFAVVAAATASLLILTTKGRLGSRCPGEGG